MSQLKKLERDQKFNTDEFNKKFEEIDTNIKKPELKNINYTKDLGITPISLNNGTNLNKVQIY